MKRDQPADPGAALTYASAGVDIAAGNEAVRRITAMVGTTRQPEQQGLEGLGGFAGLMALPTGMREPVLVSCTDGVGTKLLVAIAMDRHDSVGVDLVAMNVNDLLCTGARPLFVLDYVATGRLEPGKIEQIVAGVVAGCRQASCALLGGETAELPGMYADGHYDLAATAVGVVERASIWGAQRSRAGDRVLALQSSGLHSNGYSLARKALLSPEHAGLDLGDPLPGARATPQSVGEALLEPTRIYEPAFAALRALDGDPVHAAAHITGGGLIENPPRAYDSSLAAEIDLGALEVPAIIRAVAACGVPQAEMLRTFNCGVGMLLFVPRERADEVCAACDAAGQPATPVGELVERASAEDPAVRVRGVDRALGL
ncbi:phosphoribosylformylglycinamidine cyclo-ligase [Pseudenhygromyxa sp. WMMC2535]|uniref:phosphoribosylformylglycinamidine cyclo-ligase n=1 Tax=Pseudenhygromyxa sp. WMMC2535 TaxID=2712867 RepID=UPI001557B538|nr:phosphoribosylformylglycinamidine cyclo-ligase [Pseudenhygromyxa sp. WMMC2535]NVB41831.1 phosphoribosylformylglycinamidine cyclo-ligase [Pseudenhygromyxa sp. WMMC2535]